jgi:probable addiction module antidote protein
MTTRRQKRSRPHDAAIEELLRGDPALSAEYLDQTLREGTREEMLFAMRRVVRANGGVARIAGATGLNENTLHRTLSAKGNPRLTTLLTICDAVGMRVSISPAEPLSANS